MLNHSENGRLVIPRAPLEQVIDITVWMIRWADCREGEGWEPSPYVDIWGYEFKIFQYGRTATLDT